MLPPYPKFITSSIPINLHEPSWIARGHTLLEVRDPRLHAFTIPRTDTVIMLSLGILDLTFMTLRTEYSYDTAPDQLNRLWMPAREAHVWSNEASNTDQHQPGTVKRGKVQFVTLFGAVCYPFGISAYQ